MTSASAARVAGGSAQLLGSLARSALLVASPISGRGRGHGFDALVLMALPPFLIGKLASGSRPVSGSP